MSRAALALLAALLVWAPFPLGSNRPWAWSLLVAGLCAAFALWTIAWLRGQAGSLQVLRRTRPALILFGLWLAYLALYWIELPASWVAALSPQAAALHALAAPYATGYAAEARAALSVDPHASYVFWLKSCALGIAFFLVLALANTRERARLLALALVLSGLVQAVYGGLMHLGGADLEIFGARIVHSAQASGGFVNRNHLAGFLEIALACGIGLLVGELRSTRERSWYHLWRDTAELLLSPRAALRIALVAMVIALVMTHSRMGNTAFFTSLLIAGGTALVLSRHATRGTVLLVASLIVIDIFVVGAWFGVEKTLARIEQTTQRDVEQRVEPTVYAFDLAADYPLVGAGPGSFYTAFPRYRGPDIASFYDHAHNDYTQILVETGAIGALLIGTLPLAALVLAVLALSRRTDPLARGFAFAVIMGIAALGMHSTVDFNLQIPANSLAFVVLLAYAWIAYYLERRSSPRAAEPKGSRK